MQSDIRRQEEVASVPVKFLIVDDHPLLVEAMQIAIRVAYPDAEIVEASSISAAKEAIAAHRDFDLVLLDLTLPGTRGFDGLLELRTLFPRLAILVVSGLEDHRIVHEALSYGAAGYVVKSAGKNEVGAAIRDVLDGKVYLPSGFRAMPAGDRAATETAELAKRLASLTPQQLRVLQMLRQGMLNKQIAYELDVGETTVKAHVSEILRKLGVPTRTLAVIEMAKVDFDTILGEGREGRGSGS